MSFYFQPPDLAEFPRRSYRKFLETTLGNLFAEISPITSDFNARFGTLVSRTGWKSSLAF